MVSQFKELNLFSFRYYLEILQQEYGGAASVNLAFFRPESSFTAAQTDDAVNEVQKIVAHYEVFDETQVCGGSSVSEI